MYRIDSFVCQTGESSALPCCKNSGPEKMTSVTLGLNELHFFCNCYPHNDFTENPRITQGISLFVELTNMIAFYNVNDNHSTPQLQGSFQFSEVLS